MVKSLSVPMKMFKVAKLDVYVLNSAIDHLIFLALLRLPYGRASYFEVSTIVRRYKQVYLHYREFGCRICLHETEVQFCFCLFFLQNLKNHKVPSAVGQRAGKSGCMMVMESVKSRLKTLSIKCQLQTIDDGQLIKTDSNFLYLHSNFPDCRTKSSETGPCCLTGEVSWSADH